jgi:SAM-dependent methyltransferase
MYDQFENKVRTATPESLKASQKFYVDMFVSKKIKKVLDIGSGNGVFLDLLKEAGIEAWGIEKDKNLVHASQKRGHQIIYGDAIKILRGDIGTFEGIFASHLIEHLEPTKLFQLLRLIHQKLTPGGVFISETPNCRSIMQHLRYFYCDYTHVRFYPLELLQFFLEQVGFKMIKCGFRPDSVYIDPDKLGLKDFKIPPVSKLGMSQKEARQYSQGLPLFKRYSFLLKWKIKKYIKNKMKLSQIEEIIDTKLNSIIWVSNFVMNNMIAPNDIYVIGEK